MFEKSHTETYRRLLESIAHYSQKILNTLQGGAGDFPQWTNDLISESRSKIADVTHFLRGEANHGIRYGQADHGRAYMATANLRQINEYAKESLGYMVEGAGHFPAWVEVKISVVAKYMDLIGHWLENEGAEGRVYGSYLNPVPGDAGDEALYRGRADGIVGHHRNPYSPNSFRRKIYEQGFEEGYGGRRYGARGGDGSGGAAGGGRGAGGGGPSGSSRGAQGGRPGRRRRGHGMGRGGRRRRRHRRHVRVVPYYAPAPVAYYEGPEALPVPRVSNITARIRNGNGIFGLHGSGFQYIPGDTMEILYRLPGISDEVRSTVFIVKQSERQVEVQLPVDRSVLETIDIYDFGYYDDHGNLISFMPQISRFRRIPLQPFTVIGRTYTQTPPSDNTMMVLAPSQEAELIPTPPLAPQARATDEGIVYQPGYGSLFPGHAPTVVGKFKPSAMEHTLPPSRMLEAHRQGQQHRQLYQQTGRRFGVPGFAPGQPGWAGAGGVAQIPHPSRGRRPSPDRTFGPGLSAGQGGVQTFSSGGGPVAVQTYGSLGYASMGDGSMDMAVRGARRYSGRPKKSKKRIGPRAARRMRKRK